MAWTGAPAEQSQVGDDEGDHEVHAALDPGDRGGVAVRDHVELVDGREEDAHDERDPNGPAELLAAPDVGERGAPAGVDAAPAGIDAGLDPCAGPRLRQRPAEPREDAGAVGPQELEGDHVRFQSRKAVSSRSRTSGGTSSGSIRPTVSTVVRI